MYMFSRNLPANVLTHEGSMMQPLHTSTSYDRCDTLTTWEGD